MNNSTKLDLISFFLFSSIIFSYIISEDTLGGARQDFLKYEEIIYLFSSDLLGTLKNYASYEFTRNSPFFFILISFFHKIGLGIDTIRYINVVSIFIIIYFFFDCLKIKYKNINISVLKIFALILILSPTVRSLAVWPYPILYAFILFLVAIRYYLLFCRDKKNKLKNALFNVFFVAAASYMTPNFSVFAIYFLYMFFLDLKYSKNFFYLILVNLALAAPALIFYYSFDFYILNISVESEINSSYKFNPFSKIVIITCIIFFYFIPFLKKNIFKKFIKELKMINKNYLTLLIFLICVIFYNFPHGFGGGIIYHLSYKFFSNSFLVFLFFFIAIYVFKAFRLVNFSNILMFFCLILYNLQTSIYHKYFDPLLLFIFLFLVTFKTGLVNINLKDIMKKYYFLYIFFLTISFYKVIYLS